VAVATQNGSYPNFTSLIVPVIIHFACMFLGMVFIGLAQRKKQAAAQ
jgi:hypothetical protein